MNPPGTVCLFELVRNFPRLMMMCPLACSLSIQIGFRPMNPPPPVLVDPDRVSAYHGALALWAWISYFQLSLGHGIQSELIDDSENDLDQPLN